MQSAFASAIKGRAANRQVETGTGLKEGAPCPAHTAKWSMWERTGHGPLAHRYTPTYLMLSTQTHTVRGFSAAKAMNGIRTVAMP